MVDHPFLILALGGTVIFLAVMVMVWCVGKMITFHEVVVRLMDRCNGIESDMHVRNYSIESRLHRLENIRRGELPAWDSRDDTTEDMP